MKSQPSLKNITNAFNIVGLQVRPEAALLVAQEMSTVPEDPDLLDTVVSLVKGRIETTTSTSTTAESTMRDRTELEWSNSSNTVGKEVTQWALGQHRWSKEFLDEDNPGASSNRQLLEDSLRVAKAVKSTDDGLLFLDVFKDVTKFSFNPSTKTFTKVKGTPTFICSPSAQLLAYRHRLAIAEQRIGRNESFADVSGPRPLFEAAELCEITPIGSLFGNPGPKTTCGLVSRLKESEYSLEDCHSSVTINLENAVAVGGFIMEGSIVIAQGRMESDVFEVDAIALPPAEKRCDTPATVNFFGGDVTPADLAVLAENEPEDSMYVVLSDVHLDDGRVLNKLDTMFHGFSESDLPTGFIFMGDFSRDVFFPKPELVSGYIKGFKDLIEILQLYPQITQECHLVFIPGPGDPGANMMPRLPLTPRMTANIQQLFPKVTMASNPCRLRHFGKEIIICRQNLMKSFRQLALLSSLPVSPPPDNQQLFEEYVRTLIDQAHLCPLPASSRPIWWDFDFSHVLYPLPDFLIIGDTCPPFDTIYEGCTFCNTGSFARSDYYFYVFRPGDGELEPSTVN